tara:strand:+ start:166 stop:972 length:807 start_codon:yes stop_codon:yes gene_type:complete
MQSQEIKIEPSTSLIIKLSSYGVTLVVSDNLGNIIEFNQKQFKEYVEDSYLTENLELFIKESDINISNISNVELIVCNKLSSIVPKNLFEEKLSLDYLKFNSKLLKDDYPANDIIEEIGAVNVYLPYVNVNNYIIEKFGSFNYYHYSTILIKKLIKHNSSRDLALYANIELNNFQVLILKNRKLIYYNNFDIIEKEDILYFILFVMEQNKIDCNNYKLLLLGDIRKESDTYKLLKKFINNIEIMDFIEINKSKTKNIDNNSKVDYLLI